MNHTSYGVGIIASEDSDDLSFYINDSLRSTSGNEKVSHVLHVDSRVLFHTISIDHDGLKYKLRQTVHIIGDSFEAGDISTLRFILSIPNFTDGLTEFYRKIYRTPNTLCRILILNLDKSCVKQLSSAYSK